ncbi:MAG: DUF4129 domain-containing protein [Ferruginibacter sp.]|nr:DUF4129 domain-containing protein [Ferruginibacter sp.]
MNKALYILTLLLFISFATTAQEKKYVYQDSAYIDEPGVAVDSIITQKIEVAPEEEYEKESDEDIQYIDTTLYYRNLALEIDSINAIKNNKSFAYVKYLDSLLKEQQSKNKKEEVKEPRERSGKTWLESLFSSSIFSAILWALAIAFVLFVIYKLFFADGIFQRNTKKQDDIKELVEEEVITAETNFDRLITNAEQEGNYRLAVRYQYLKQLHMLAQQNVIQLAADKTNYQYVQEINNETIRNAFAKTTLNYEYVWYGEFEIDNSLYQQLKTSFNNFPA